MHLFALAGATLSLAQVVVGAKYNPHSTPTSSADSAPTVNSNADSEATGTFTSSTMLPNLSLPVAAQDSGETLTMSRRRPYGSGPHFTTPARSTPGAPVRAPDRRVWLSWRYVKRGYVSATASLQACGAPVIRAFSGRDHVLGLYANPPL
ncbi:hypothetical protein BDK51DRAFT_36672 [Blyttiomyces helicus]|uniref:Uncharacterized protein n=1 Tax=Blyttiomyces helicus TaxID=388810 RepID=A0A4P9W2Q5_9FUNG|nr:hypothetical protein BDK51DRAFT_36672 [Blyttiomyces helicus]|eukprot:RKO86032.1 hypothetical protein BDK51DRAFT_36672 [Blyttiomyces helicus]